MDDSCVMAKLLSKWNSLASLTLRIHHSISTIQILGALFFYCNRLMGVELCELKNYKKIFAFIKKNNIKLLIRQLQVKIKYCHSNHLAWNKKDRNSSLKVDCDEFCTPYFVLSQRWHISIGSQNLT